MKKKVIIFLYNRFFDPLIQSNFWLYIQDYIEKSDSINFHLISYEDNFFPLTFSQLEKINTWKKQGLEWTRLKWHPGTKIISKFLDMLSGFTAVAILRMRGYCHIITLASVAGTFGYIYARLLGMRLFLYQFEPHSEYAVDNGMWLEKSFIYKVSNFLEKRSANFAVVVSSGTKFMQYRLEEEWKIKGKFFKIATVANSKKFKFNEYERNYIRSCIGINNEQWVLFYPGKFGSLYYYDEIAFMYKWLRELECRLHFLIVTPHEKEEIYSIFDKANVDKSTYTVCHSDYADIHKYYFAADFAIIAVPPGPSKKFISNIKVGEYLCAGLPFLITSGISEDYLYAKNNDVGVVVGNFSEDEIKSAWPDIKRYLEMNSENRRFRCREVGIAYRGFDTLNPIFKEAINYLINS